MTEGVQTMTDLGVAHEESTYRHLLDGLAVDTSGRWTDWDWKRVGPVTSYDHARLEEYRDSVVVAYRLYNRIGLEHARRLLSDAPLDAKILDVGGGTGRKAIPLAQDGFTNITIVDIAPDWLRLAGQKALVAGVRDRLTLLHGDIRHMPEFSDGSFDHVLALGGVITYCGAPDKALCEAARVLAPGGRLLADGIHSTFGSLHYAARHRDLATLEAVARRQDRGQRFPLLLPEGLEALAVDAGLADVRVGSEFIFQVDDTLRVGPDTERWERAILELEMRYHDDPRFLGAGGLMLTATKPAG